MSFRLKTVLGIAAIEVVVMAILIAVNQFGLGGSASTQLYDRTKATAHIFSNAVTDAVIATDLATLDATIETAVSNADLAYIRVRNQSGTILSQGGSSDALAVDFVRDESFETAKKDHIIDIDVPVVVEGVTFGTVELGMSTEKVESELASALQWNLLVALIGMSLVAVFGFGLGSALTYQLKWLQEGADRISNGDLESKIQVRGRDELAQTAHCFNQMADALALDRARLRHQRNQLLKKKQRVDSIVECMTAISEGRNDVQVPETHRDDEIGNMARATVVFDDSMRNLENARLVQQRLISAFDQVAEQVAIFDVAGRSLFLNAAFRRFNATIVSALPDQFSLEDFLTEGVAQAAFPEAQSAPEAWVSDYLQRQDGAPIEEKRAPDRIILTVLSRVSGIGVVMSSKDITELRQSEAQLIQASKMATLGEMATGIAHELNQPLGVIRMAASNSVKRIAKGSCDPEYLSTKLARISEQTERASQIINHMRVFGRKADGRSEPFDLRDSLLEMSTLARAQLQSLDISLKVDIPEASAFVMGEKVIFEQVLLNLVSNARDAIEDQAQGDREIRISAEFNSDDGHVLHVEDTGGGIPEKILHKLFEPFFTTKEPGKGTGLGLSISFGTIQQMSGSVRAANIPGGSRFSISLPVFENVAETADYQGKLASLA